MEQNLFDYYCTFSQFTYPGLYQENFQRDLPTDIGQAGRLVKQQVISIASHCLRAERASRPIPPTGISAKCPGKTTTFQPPWLCSPNSIAAICVALSLIGR